MPHVLYHLQGVQTLELKMGTDPHGHAQKTPQLVLQSPGTLSPPEYVVPRTCDRKRAVSLLCQLEGQHVVSPAAVCGASA